MHSSWWILNHWSAISEPSYNSYRLISDLYVIQNCRFKVLQAFRHIRHVDFSVAQRHCMSPLSLACSPWVCSVLIFLKSIWLIWQDLQSPLNSVFIFALYAFFCSNSCMSHYFLTAIFSLHESPQIILWSKNLIIYGIFNPPRIWESIINSQLYRGLFKIFGSVNIVPNKSMLLAYMSAPPRGMTLLLSWLEPREVAEIHGMFLTNFLMLSLSGLR